MMTSPRLGRFWFLVSVVLAGSSALADEPEPDKLAEGPPVFVLGIAEDGSVTLDGRRVAREDLANESVRLGDRIRSRSKAEGKDVDTEQGLPAVIVVWAADETPYSVISRLMIDCQSGGFRRWSFAPKSAYPEPPANRSPEPPVDTPRRRSSELADTIKTIPIRLRADDRGLIETVAIGDRAPQDFDSFRLELSMMLDDPDSPFDRALLKIDSKLTYSEVVRTAGFLQKYKINKISMMEVRPEGE